MSNGILDVWVGETRVGQLIREDHTYIFQYRDIASLDPQKDLVSLTMPVRGKQYETQVLMPPFQMVLPEGALLEYLRMRFAKVMNITDDIMLLSLIGNHTIGRVRFTEAGASLQQDVQTSWSLAELLTYQGTEDLFRELMDELASRSGVSGVQPKVLWNDYGRKIALPAGFYILKSAGREYPGLAVNEYFCLKAAQACGLTTPDYYLADSGEMLVVKRFDIDKNNHRLAFEEVCALQHLSTHGKYQGSYEAVAETIQKTPCDPPGETRRDLFKSVLLSMMLKNGDAHLKNFGILYHNTERKWLAPVYDLVCTVVYQPKDVPALTLAGKKQWPGLEALVDFGLHACNLRKKDVKQGIDEVKAGMVEIRHELKKFSAEHKQYSELCERMALIINSHPDI
ncbi:MAG: type II toxin-antitoxin system HipA family toxin [Gammaproteobacteria bacterium]|nr:type II toxin-antitoxin system HipA family toxin [Gammaproteobacteria bacterium]